MPDALADVVFVLLTVVLYALMLLVVTGLERFVIVPREAREK